MPGHNVAAALGFSWYAPRIARKGLNSLGGEIPPYENGGLHELLCPARLGASAMMFEKRYRLVICDQKMPGRLAMNVLPGVH